ncbi:NUDIX hydrolase [Agromyces seonyuensis]|uniref:NUDIX domain-containing protein n=1 Tax=Agromyces seonyuensis TaxID=2662446 RepID=A0A6I4NTA6_9MICO|nr:NUDIX hydrolase [Agromyces seonyuensis]MWB97453.1 NUDIX domain-containing protein [Agromyces seonyuensis]
MDLRIAAYGVIIRDGLVLLSHWNELGRSGWTLPGGGLEGDEHPIDGAIREIREETGYDAEVERLLGVDRIIIPRSRRHPGAKADQYGLRIVYRARVIGGELANEVGGSSDEARWFRLGEVPRLHRVGLVDIGLGLDRDEPADGRPRG